MFIGQSVCSAEPLSTVFACRRAMGLGGTATVGVFEVVAVEKHPEYFCTPNKPSNASVWCSKSGQIQGARHCSPLNRSSHIFFLAYISSAVQQQQQQNWRRHLAYVKLGRKKKEKKKGYILFPFSPAIITTPQPKPCWTEPNGPEPRSSTECYISTSYATDYVSVPFTSHFETRVQNCRALTLLVA